MSSTAIEAEEPECRVDRDCPPRLACIDNICQDPCLTRNICQGQETCVVLENAFTPSRVIACVCPEGTVSDGNGNCRSGIDIVRIRFAR